MLVVSASPYLNKIYCATVQELAGKATALNQSFIPICSLQSHCSAAPISTERKKGLLEKQRHRRRHQVKNLAVFNQLPPECNPKACGNWNAPLRPSQDQRELQVLQNSAALKSCQYQKPLKTGRYSGNTKKKNVYKKKISSHYSHKIIFSILRMKGAPNMKSRSHLLPQQEGKQPRVIQTLCSSD